MLEKNKLKKTQVEREMFKMNESLLLLLCLLVLNLLVLLFSREIRSPQLLVGFG